MTQLLISATSIMNASNSFISNYGYEINYLFFGAFSMMIIYNFIYYTVLKSNTYIDYFFFHTLVFLIMLSFSGIAFKETQFFSYSINAISVVPFLLATLSFSAFTRNFLELKANAPKLEKTVISLQFVNLALFGLSFLELQENIILSIGMAFIVVLLLALLSIGIYLGFKENRMNARFYTLGFSVILLSLIYAFTANLVGGQVSESILYIIEFAILFEAAIFSYALSYKYRQSKINLKQNELLFKELSHRVKNNLQSIISILSLQKSRLKDTDLKEQLDGTIKRVRSISLIHEKLQHSDLISSVQMQDFFSTLIKDFSQLNSEVKFQVECKESLILSVEKLTPLALILNELITNSIKHAFIHSSAPQIKLSLVQTEEAYIFNYKDNGEGFNDAKESLGTLLINTLSTTQLKGEFKVISSPNYSFSLSF